MSTTDATNEQAWVVDVDSRLPLYPDFADHPTDLRYHQYYDEEADAECEIFVPTGKEQEVLDHEKNQEWAKLREYPPFSDCPDPKVTPKVIGIGAGDGTEKQFFIPEDKASQMRAVNLVKAKDYATLEKEFEPWNNQPHPEYERKFHEWLRGIEREALKRQAKGDGR